MDAREFVALLKTEAMDGAVETLLKTLNGPRNSALRNVPADAIGKSIAEATNVGIRRRNELAAWFQALNAQDQRIIASLLEECSGIAVASVLTVIDGVGGDSAGVFEIVEVSEDDRQVINPENSEMLHDLFAEVCEEARSKD